MNTTKTGAAAHAALMNATYRHQRRIYDITRRFFLFGRDHLIENLCPPPGANVLEIACGTGRNLAHMAERYPGCHLHGLDISTEMLRSARARLGDHAQLAEADACSFRAEDHFGVAGFDRIVLSYGLSMIPDWTGALGNAVRHLGERGQVHVVDFGDQEAFPRWFRAGLGAWLGRFHVAPRTDLRAVMAEIAAETGGSATWRSLHGGYAQYGVLSRP